MRIFYYSVYADALLWFQQGRIVYDTFCLEFQELSSKTRYVQISGKAERDGWTCTPFDGRQLKRYIASMLEVVEA